MTGTVEEQVFSEAQRVILIRDWFIYLFFITRKII